MTISREECHADEEALARAIRSRIVPGDRVVFLSPDTPAILIAQFAVRLAAGILIALKPGLAPAEVRCLRDHSEASLLSYDAESGCSESGVAIGHDSCLFFGSTIATDESPVRWEIDDERAVISINYTTGKPKGVMCSHRGACLTAMGEVFHNGLDNKSVYLWTLPLFHCNGWCTPLAVTAASGIHACLRAVRAASFWAVSTTSGSPTSAGHRQSAT